MYIAHIREKDGKIQTAADHSEGVKRLAEAFSEGLSIPHIMRIAALLHDAGKMNNDFNGYIMGDNSIRRGQIDHSYAGAKYIIELAESMEEKKGERIRETACFIARVIAAHHGLNDWIDTDYRDRLRLRTGKTERYEEICGGIKTLAGDEELCSELRAATAEYTAVTDRLFGLCETNGKKSSVRYYFYMGMLERLAESVLVDADRTDTACFTDDIRPRDISVSDVWEKMSEGLREVLAEFKNRTDGISRRRMDISDRCAAFAEKERGICRLVVPTGGGKTLSSLRFAVNYCRKFGKKRIFYIAPFMSILEQNSDVLRKIAGDEYLLEHHSNISAEIDETGELNEYELKCAGWEDPVIATTAVQFLNTLFSGKMSCVRRFHRLENSVIIIDEVQSLPIKCVHLFNLAMNFLSAVCGAAVVLCSATQPAFETSEHPLLLDKEESMTGDFSEDFRNFKRTELISDIRTEQYSFEQAAEYAYEKFLAGGNLLMILNTKRAAAELFKRLKEILGEREEGTGKTEIFYMSTLMCPCHRRETLDRVRSLLNNKKPVICVTTQLIEAGVDISFNCVIRSAAGLDSAAQAAGRCNRHGDGEVRPVYVINIKDENLGRGLSQIKSGRDIFVQLAGTGKYDLMSSETMAVYFRKLYGEYVEFLDYPAEDMSGVKTSLLDMLSVNTNRSQLCTDRPFGKQAFYTAGRLFKVIDENTRDIIVPYNEEAEKIILDLNSDIKAEEGISLLRKAQKYCVSVYDRAFDNMRKNGQIHKLSFDEIYALDKSFFSSELGIDTENAAHELMLY